MSTMRAQGGSANVGLRHRRPSRTSEECNHRLSITMRGCSLALGLILGSFILTTEAFSGVQLKTNVHQEEGESRSRRSLQVPPVSAPLGNLLANPSFELSPVGSQPTDWGSVGNVTVTNSLAFDGGQALQLGFCQICNPVGPIPLGGSAFAGFTSQPDQWYNLYFYVAALGAPGVPQSLTVILGSYTGGIPANPVALNFTMVPGAASLSAPGTVNGQPVHFEMASAVFQTGNSTGSVFFQNDSPAAIIVDSVTIMPVNDPVAVVPGNSFALAQPCFVNCPTVQVLTTGGAYVASEPTSAANTSQQQVITLGNSTMSTGSAFYQSPLQLLTTPSAGSCSSYSFAASFSLRSKHTGSNGSSSSPVGFAFVITPDPIQGGPGGMLGYGRVCNAAPPGPASAVAGVPATSAQALKQNSLCRPSVAVEFDAQQDLNLQDLNSNHIGLDANFNPISLEALDLSALNLGDGQWHSIRVTYNASSSLLLVQDLTGGYVTTLLKVQSFDLCSMASASALTAAGLAPLYVGFTGASTQDQGYMQLSNATLLVMEQKNSGSLGAKAASLGSLDNLVVNPGFESWLPSAGSALASPDSQSLPGWELALGNAWVVQRPPNNVESAACKVGPYEGAAALALGGCPAGLCGAADAGAACPGTSGQGVVQQTLNNTADGETYTVILSVWAPPGATGSNPATLTVQAGDVTQGFSLTSLPQPTNPSPSFGYQQVSIAFVASGSSTALTITGASPTGSVVVDAVTVIHIPSSGLITVPGFTLANFSSAAFQDSLNDPVSSKYDDSLGTNLQATLNTAPSMATPSSMFTTGSSAVLTPTDADSAPTYLSLNSPQPYTTGLSLYPAAVPVASFNGTDSSGNTQCQSSSFSVSFSFAGALAVPAGSTGTPKAALSGGFALVLVQDPVPGSPQDGSLGFARNCVSNGACSGGLAIGFPGAPSCFTKLNGTSTVAPGMVLFRNPNPLPQPSSMCTAAAPPEFALSQGSWDVTVVYSALEKKLAAWVSVGQPGQKADTSGPPALLQAGVDMCEIFNGGGSGGSTSKMAEARQLQALIDGGNPVIDWTYPAKAPQTSNQAALSPVNQGAAAPAAAQPVAAAPKSPSLVVPTATNPPPVAPPPVTSSAPPPATAPSGTPAPTANTVAPYAGSSTSDETQGGNTISSTGPMQPVYLGFSAASGNCGTGADNACVSYQVLTVSFADSIPNTLFPPAPPAPGNAPPGSPSPPLAPFSMPGKIPGWAIGLAVAGWLLVIGILAAILIFVRRRNMKHDEQLQASAGKGAYPADGQARPIALADVHKATKGFHSSRQLGGPGAYGTMYRGQSPFGLQWAVKNYKMSSGVSPASFGSFAEEVKRLASLQHPSVVPVLGYHSSGGDPPDFCVVYEYSAYESLFECLHKRKEPVLTMLQRVRIILSLSDTLSSLHSASPPIVHRNLKPTNVLLNSESLPVLTDFCFARSVGQPPKGQSKDDSEVKGAASGGKKGAGFSLSNLVGMGPAMLSPVKEESGPLSQTNSAPLAGNGEPAAQSGEAQPLVVPGNGVAVADVLGSKSGTEEGAALRQVGSENGRPLERTTSGRRPPFVPRRAQKEGYTDPEVVLGISSSSSPKADVFSFGVVVLELLTGRLAVMPDPDDPQTNLVITDWAVHYIETGEVNLIADPRVFTPQLSEPMLQLGQVAVECVRTPSSQRPDMATVSRMVQDIWAKYFDSTPQPSSSNTSIDIVNAPDP